MKVEIHSVDTNNPESSGKTARFDSINFRVSAGERMVKIVGESWDGAGDGSRGGDEREFKKKLALELKPSEVLQIVSAAIKAGTIFVDPEATINLDQLLKERLKVGMFKPASHLPKKVPLPKKQ